MSLDRFDCIIQRFFGDYDEEARRMENLYNDAYCVLAASCAIDQRSGFLLPRPGRRRSAVVLNCQDGENGTIYVCSRIGDFRKDVL
jgi:hypothetical protein